MRTRRLLLTLLFAFPAYAQETYQCAGCQPVTTWQCEGPCSPTAQATPTPTATPTRTATPTPQATSTPNPIRTINFQEDTQAIFPSPGMGFQTTQKPLNEVSNPRNIPSTSEVFRFYAEEINPSPGVFTWGIIDNAITKARAAGQTLNIRIIMYDPYGGRWLKGVVPGRNFRETSEGNGVYFAPNFDAAATKSAHRDLLQAVSARYANNPTIEHVDIGSVGSYSEWHHWAMVDTATNGPVPMPSESSSAEIVEAYRLSFALKHVALVLDGEWARKYGKAFAGWRKDCAGGGHETDPNQYPKWMISPVDLRDQWKNYPVLLEPCGAMTNTNWGSAKWRVDRAIADHVSLYNTKNGIGSIPESQWPEWQRLLRKIGYRFVLRKAEIGNDTFLTLTNVGIAPNYKPIWLHYGGQSFNVQKVLPGTLVGLRFTAKSGTLTATYDTINGKPVRFANQEYQNGGIRIE